ncbi:MAG: hypothetical protein ACXVII_45745, partial [Solirubrobacteraceae bacterium]
MRTRPLVGRVLLHSLQVAGLDRLSERTGAPALLTRSGLGPSLSALLVRAVRIGLTIVVIL